MSLAEFSNTMRTRFALEENPEVFLAIEDWTQALQNSKKTGGVSGEKIALGTASSLLLEDKIDPANIDGRPVSQFRTMGQALSHNISVVTEETLVRHWKFYNLKVPKIDGIEVLPGSTTISKAGKGGLMAAYILWYNNKYNIKDKPSLEYYSNSGVEESSSTNTIGVRFSSTYTNTASIMLEFLTYCGLSSKDASEYGSKFEVGHIESQAFIRLKVTASRNHNVYSNTFIDKIIKLHEYLDIASSSLLPEYSSLRASILKDTTNVGNLYVNVEMQLKDTEDPRAKRVKLIQANTNQGSGALSRALNFVSILKDIGSTPGIYSADTVAFREIGADSETIIKKLQELHTNYKTYYKEVSKALNASKIGTPEEVSKFLLELKSSKTIKQQAVDSISSALLGNNLKDSIRVSHNGVPIVNFERFNKKAATLDKDITYLSSKIKQNLTKLKNVKVKPITTQSPAAQLRTTGGQFYSLTSLQSLLNTHLQDVISANMGNEPWEGGQRRILNYRTGRFAASASVERMSQSKEGAITAFYTYMKYPYQTFEPGFAQGSPASRDPKLLIAKSIREIAATKVANRMRSVLV